MAERPDLEYLVPLLAAELIGRTVTDLRVRRPVVLRLAVPGTPAEAVAGRPITAVVRRGHFVLFTLGDDRELVVSPMLAGRFALDDAGAGPPADLALAFALDDGRELRYRDDVQMGKVYVIPRGAHAQVPGLAHIGVDVLDARRFTRAAFRALARARRDQAKVFLMDKAALDSFGNAYADEALFCAGVHPKARVAALTDTELDRLHDAMVAVLSEARATLAKRRPPIDVKLRDFLQIRNRHGEPCPRCGAKIRRAGVHGHDAFFCPTCQPEKGRGGIVDWRKTEK